MEEEILMFILATQVQRKKEKTDRRVRLWTIRDTSDPFALPEEEFTKKFRLSKSLCHQLIAELQPYDRQETSLPFVFRFLGALNFFGHGSYQKCVGNNTNLPMSQPSISRSIRAVAQLIIRCKAGEVKFPLTDEEINSAKTGFFAKFGIKCTVGAIDCTHIAIIAPNSNIAQRPLSMYMNRKGFYSINVEAICDHRLIFTFINTKFPGATHDSGIWATSEAREHLIRTADGNHQTWLIGDQGYPLEPWLMTPLSEPSTQQERKYNKIHASARNCIERAFGVLKTRFRCLSKHRVLHYTHETAAAIINCFPVILRTFPLVLLTSHA